MKLSEIIAAIGDENVTVQNVHEATERLDWDAKNKAVKIKFVTREIGLEELLSEKFKKIGLVIWFDRERYDEAMREIAARLALPSPQTP